MGVTQVLLLIIVCTAKLYVQLSCCCDINKELNDFVAFYFKALRLVVTELQENRMVQWLVHSLSHSLIIVLSVIVIFF